MVKRWLVPGVFWLFFGGLFSQCATSGEKITVAAGSLAGAWSAISEGFVSCIRRGLPGVAVTSEPGLDGANAALVDSGRVQFGLIHSSLARLGMRGEYPYQEELKNIRNVSLVFADSAFHFLVHQRTGLTSIQQIKERCYPLRLSVIYRGSLSEIGSQAVLNAYGISYEDIEACGGKVYFRALRPSLELMKDGRLDAVSAAVQYPQTQIVEAARHQDLRLLALSEPIIESVNEKLGTYPFRIPAGSYSFMQQDTPTFADVAILMANADLEEELVYRVTQSLYENLDFLHNVHRALSGLSLETMVPKNDPPLHPGAARFYREKR